MASNPYALPTLTAGMLVGNAELQAMVDGVNWGQGTPQSGKTRRPVFSLKQTVAQSIPTASNTAILFDSEPMDTDNGHSTTTNTSQYVFQTSGTWFLFGAVPYVANAAGGRDATFRLSASTYLWWAKGGASPSFSTSITTSGIVVVNAGDYVELVGYQNSGGSLNTDTAQGGARLAGFMLTA